MTTQCWALAGTRHCGFSTAEYTYTETNLMKLTSGDSGACAARLKRSSSNSTTFWKESRKMPLMLHSTSTRGRPSSSCKTTDLVVSSQTSLHVILESLGYGARCASSDILAWNWCITGVQQCQVHYLLSRISEDSGSVAQAPVSGLQ